jgi:hypothetical protein
VLRLLSSRTRRRAVDLRRGGADRWRRPIGAGAVVGGAFRSQAARPTTAIFYSISNCQAGLTGISFGNFLIKQVVNDLANEQPQLKNFVTLSPLPGFMAWLRRLIEAENGSLAPETHKLLARLDDPAWVDDAAARDACLRRPDAARRPLSVAGKAPQRAAGRSGGPLPSRQWRAHRETELARQTPRRAGSANRPASW